MKKGWEALKGGSSDARTGVHATFARAMRRLMAAGWTWKQIEKPLIAGRTLQALVDELGDAPPTKPEPPPKPAKTIKPPPMEVIVTPKGEPVRDSWQIVQQERIKAQRELRNLEIKIAKDNLELCRDRWATVEAFPSKRTKTSHETGPCKHCGKPVTKQTVVIHPGKVDINGLVRLQKEALDRLRLAHNMPKAVMSIRVDGGEKAELLERVNEAFKTAFTDGIKAGLVTEQAAVEIWETARRLIDGANEMTADV